MVLHKRLLVAFCLLSALIACLSVRTTHAETFRNPRRIPLAKDPYGVTTGDLNGDGRNDIVWTELPAYPNVPVLHVLLAGANGQYSSAPDLELPVYLTFVQCIVEDVTGDKRNDLVCSGIAGNYNDVFLVYPGEGDGTFAAPIETTVASYTASSPAILARAGDLNGDGFADIIVENVSSAGILAYLSDGKGAFTAAAPFQGSFNTSVPVVTDLNGDGKLDVLWPTGPRVNLGNGDGTFSAPLPYDPGYLSNCAFGDVDGDGHLDAACTWFDTSDLGGYIHLTVLHGNSDGSFNKTPLFSRTFGTGENGYDGLSTIISPVLIADLDGDGYADIVSLSGDGYCVLLGGPNTTWNGQPQQFVSASTQSTGYIVGIYGVSIADMNGDGVPDIVAVGPNGLFITYAQRDGTLSSAPATEVGQVSTSAALVDVNGDGNLDVVSAGDSALKLSLGRGDGTFGPPQPISTVGNFGRVNYVLPVVISGDFNGDGKQDLLATGSVSAYTSQNYILFGHGDGSFDPPAPISISLGKVADLNNDHRSDVISIHNDATASNVLNASLSHGDGSFTTVSTNLPVELAPNGFVDNTVGPALGDFRHSGLLDVAVASMNNAYLLRSHGDGTFDSTGTTLAIPGLPNIDKSGVYDIAAGDFDNDGNLDIAVLSEYGSGIYDLGTPTSAVWVFYGNGDGSFSSATLAGVFNRDAQTLSAGDLNGDGLADLVLTSYDFYQYNGVLIVHSLPNRAWGSEVDYTGGEGLSPLWITDINHDGRNDLIFSNSLRSNYATDSISVLLNQHGSLVDGSLSATPEPSNVTYPFTLHAILTPTNPGDMLDGSVAFELDGVAVGNVALSGNAASLALSGVYVAAGTHSLSATWPGDSTYPPVTLNGSHTVSTLPLTISLGATPQSLAVGGTVTAIAIFTPGLLPNGAGYQFNGNLTLYDNGVVVAQQQVSRSGYSFTLPSLAVGTHTLSASYAGDSLFSPAQSNSVTVTVTGAPSTTTLTAAPATSVYGTPVTLTAHVMSAIQGIFSGTVNFYADNNLLNSGTVANGSASIVTTSLSSGSHSLTCAYSGDATFSASTCAPVSFIVNDVSTALTLVSSANPAPALSPVTFTANLVAQNKPSSGSVLFSVDGVAVGTIATGASGSAAYTKALSAGTHSVSAQFTATSGFGPSSASLAESVAANPTTTEIMPSAGPIYQDQPLVLVSTITARTGTSSPNGIVTISEGSTILAQATTPSSASGSTSTVLSLNLPSLPPGTHVLTAAYKPADGNFLPSASPTLSAVVVPRSFSLSISTPSLSILIEHHKSFSASVQSLGAFQGPVKLSCAVPPDLYLTCQITDPLLKLAVNGSATSKLTLDTDAVLGFKSSLEGGPRHSQSGWQSIALVILLPLPFGALVRCRRPKLASILLLLLLGAAAALAGCGDKYPAHTPPGNYQIVITASGTSAGSTAVTTRTTEMQLTVTSE